MDDDGRQQPHQRHQPQEHQHQKQRRRRRRRRLAGDLGEGVVSAAIAVLVMAFLGALMWVGFRAMWETTEANTRTQVEQIGK